MTTFLNKITDMYARAYAIADLDWPLRWRVGREQFSRLMRETLPDGESMLHPAPTGDSLPTLMGVPVAIDRDAAHDLIEIEARTPGGWVLVLRRKDAAPGRADVDSVALDGAVTTYPLSPVQDEPLMHTAWPYEHRGGLQIWTDAEHAPVGAVLALEALPPCERDEIRVPERPHLPLLTLDADASRAYLERLPPLKFRCYRRERWLYGSEPFYLWRRVE